MPRQDVIFIHGGSCWASYGEYLNDLKKSDFKPGGGSPFDNWQQSLQKTLGPRFRVLLPEMPNWQNAKYLEWKIWFDKILQASGAGPIVVGHSLGGIFLIKYFSETKAAKAVKNLFLVSAPYATLREDPDFGDFALKRIPNGLGKYGDRLRFYHSKDDPIVPFEHMEKYQRILPGSRFRTFEHRGHFLQKDFAELVYDLKKT